MEFGSKSKSRSKKQMKEEPKEEICDQCDEVIEDGEKDEHYSILCVRCDITMCNKQCCGYRCTQCDDYPERLCEECFDKTEVCYSCENMLREEGRFRQRIWGRDSSDSESSNSENSESEYVPTSESESESESDFEKPTKKSKKRKRSNRN